MRRGRFAGLSAHGPPEAGPLPLGELLLFDLTAPLADERASILAERLRSLAVSIPSLAASHLLWCLFVLGAVYGETGGLSLVALPFAAVLLLDAGLWWALSRWSGAAYRKMRVAGLYLAASAALWASAILILGAAGEGHSLIARAALVAAFGSGIATFFAVPLLLVGCCAVTIAGIALLNSSHPLLGIAAAASFFFAILSISRARDLIHGAQQRLAAQWEAKKARQFIAEFEESGRGWFWETNSEGAVTYLSRALERRLGIPAGAAAGRPLEDLLLPADEESGEARRTLAFHLAARFPFVDVIVRAPLAGDGWWSLSGSPSFDDCGRFLGFRGIGSNLTEQRRTDAERTKLARYDSLTGLPNRAMMRDTLDEALANAAERRKGCALMMIDLDRFKQVNDTLGHPIGDKLLKDVAQRLGSVLGRDGQVGRLGGDEFEAILPGMVEEGRLSELASALIAEVSRPYEVDGHHVEIGVSAGIAVARPGRSIASGLIRDADLALYAAKAAGRGTFRFFAPEMHEQVAERQILENDLREALAGDQLTLLYQPIVDTVSEEVVAFEALLRWQHPTRGTLQPSLVVPLADECGLMPRIGDWVLRSACAEAAKWPDHVRIAVNLSPGQFADAALPAIVTGAIAAAGIAAERLELEITEGAFPTDASAPARMLARLKAIGVRLALDNFGTGQSGLGHLRDAPLDKIKIDRGFVRGAAALGSRNAAIVRAIVVLAESLAMETTAEGAETLEELALIRRLGCSQVQGYLFGRPMAAEDALALAEASRPTAMLVRFTRPPRHRLIRNGLLQYGGESLPVRLRNISVGGAMIECERAIDPDAVVTLELDQAGQLPAEVRWSQRGQIGLRFERPFELRHLSRPRAGASGLKMLTPSYLEAPPAEAEPEAPIRRRPARR